MNKSEEILQFELRFDSWMPSGCAKVPLFRSAMVGDKEVGGDLPTIADDLVVTKYKMAAEIVNSKFLSGLVPCSVLDTLDSDVGVLIT